MENPHSERDAPAGRTHENDAARGSAAYARMMFCVDHRNAEGGRLSMDLERLNQHIDLIRRLKQAEALLSNLRAQAEPGAQVLTGMPHAPGISDKVGNLAVELADASREVDRLAAAVVDDERDIVEYIDAISDIQTRMAFRLHFIRTLTWAQIAGIFGGYVTENTVRQLCYRQLRKNEDAAKN